MNLSRDRRLFLKAGTAVAAAAALGRRGTAAEESSSPKSNSANDQISVGVIGVNGRGSALARGFMSADNAEVAYICDVDSRAAEKATEMVRKKQKRAPKTVTDLRRMLDDSSLDAIVVATPNHWHAPAAIMGCNAGKHVYVEKPCSHNAQEGEWSVQAARKNRRVVQMGTQRRSWPAIVEAVERVHRGDIGRTLYSRTWYNNRRSAIGTGETTEAPSWLDWELWQGPAPRQPYKDNLVHYNWHWHWDYGNGELGNNGVHGIDVARWGLDVSFPERVTAGGGKYRHEDDQQTPDTMMVTYDFPEEKTITWEGLSWSPLGVHDSRFGISFHGTEGSIVIRGAGYAVYDMQGNETEAKSGHGGDGDHLANFLDCIRNDRRPNADIEEAHRSTLLCHLGNIAFRNGDTLHTDPTNGHIRDNAKAEAMWSREYADGWKPQV